VTGSEFTPPNTVSLVLIWSDTGSGTIVKSEIQWGPQGGPFVTVTQPRQPFDSQNTYQFTNLAPNQTYQFRVRDWDQTTSTQWSPWKNVSTSGSTANQVMLWLDNDFGNPLGTVIVAADGTFSTSVVIPNTTVPGPHLLNAQLMGGEAAFPLAFWCWGRVNRIRQRLS
jgi:Fibronectin type III domain